MSEVEARAKTIAEHPDPGPAWMPDPLTGPAPKRERRIMPVLLTTLVVAVAALLGWAMWDAYMGAPWTRDGTVRAYVVTMAPEVAGHIVELPIVDNKYVHKGDLLMVIDPTNYQIGVSQAEGAVHQAEASVQNIDAQIAVQQAQIESNRAQVDRAQAALVFAKEQADRYTKLAQDGWGHRSERPELWVATARAGRGGAGGIGKPGARTAANRVAAGTASERRGEPRADPGGTSPGAGKSPTHAHCFAGRWLCDEPARGAWRLRQCRRDHHLGCRRQFLLGRRVFRGDQRLTDPRRRPG